MPDSGSGGCASARRAHDQRIEHRLRHHDFKRPTAKIPRDRHRHGVDVGDIRGGGSHRPLPAVVAVGGKIARAARRNGDRPDLHFVHFRNGEPRARILVAGTQGIVRTDIDKPADRRKAEQKDRQCDQHFESETPGRRE